MRICCWSREMKSMIHEQHSIPDSRPTSLFSDVFEGSVGRPLGHSMIAIA